MVKPKNKVVKHVKTKPKNKKLTRLEKGRMYSCEICGSQIVCILDSKGNLTCCEEPMCVIC